LIIKNNKNKNMTDTELTDFLNKIFKEKSISKIILDYKNDMDLCQLMGLYNKHKGTLDYLSLKKQEMEYKIRILKKKIKKKCNHISVTHVISPGWERSSHTYYCNECKFSIRIHSEFDYTNITKVIDY
jgi:hypothetical protein